MYTCLCPKRTLSQKKTRAFHHRESLVGRVAKRTSAEAEVARRRRARTLVFRDCGGRREKKGECARAAWTEWRWAYRERHKKRNRRDRQGIAEGGLAGATTGKRVRRDEAATSGRASGREERKDTAHAARDGEESSREHGGAHKSPCTGWSARGEGEGETEPPQLVPASSLVRLSRQTALRPTDAQVARFFAGRSSTSLHLRTDPLFPLCCCHRTFAAHSSFHPAPVCMQMHPPVIIADVWRIARPI